MKFNLENLKDIKRIVKELSVGLRSLNFIDNFTSFDITDIIPNSGTIIVRNKLDSTDIRYLVTSNDGDGVISKGSTWNKNYLSFKNNGTITANVEILIIKK